ncbi:MAG: hypothetical protein ABR912_00755 [Terracidiphilus sp.]|jgi:hypothetical protein
MNHAKLAFATYKAILLVCAVLFAASALAQNPYGSLPAACGPKNVTFDVADAQELPSQNPLTQPGPGSALVYFIQDSGFWGDAAGGDHQHYTLKIGLDGAWVGAYKQNSYLALSVKPGERHACANVQSSSSLGSLVALLHFTAEQGKIYYFRTRFISGMPGQIPPYIDFDPVDSDEAKYLIDSHLPSVFHANFPHPKK